MSSRLTQVLLGLSLLLNCFVLAGFVYRSWIAPPEMAFRGPPPGPRPGPLEMLSKELKLDDSQREATRDVFEHYATSRRERFQQIQKIREQMAAELKKPEFDMSRIDPLIDQMIVLRGEQLKGNLSSISELASRLRPEQRERLHKILGERFGSPQGRPPGGPGPGPGRPSQ
ncbi:MAG: Spy/CpxP family protein refolding chaperone [Reyranellales bacterium]